jgi:hypothetical protein
VVAAVHREKDNSGGLAGMVRIHGLGHVKPESRISHPGLDPLPGLGLHLLIEHVGQIKKPAALAF